MTAATMTQAVTRWLGTGEPNEIQAWYRDRNGADYSGNFAWCDAGITRASADAGEYDAVCFGTDHAYTPEHAQTFKDHGQWTYGMDGIREGDIVFFDWQMPAPGQGRISQIDHVEYVTGRQGDYALTIGFNTLDTCARRVRGADVIVGYGRPAYSQDGQPPAPPAPPAAPVVLKPYPGHVMSYDPNHFDPDVQVFQQRFIDRGWSGVGPADGYFGRRTRDTVIAFQREKFPNDPREWDAEVGLHTWTAAFRTDNVT